MQKTTKGIILAAGLGRRMLPLTKTISKHLIPIYDKPMIYYPLSTLMLSGIKDILIITSKKDKKLFEDLLGNGQSLGINIDYKIQMKPLGICHAFIIGEKFIGDSSVTLILGDNFFHGSELVKKLKNSHISKGAKIFVYPVKDPSAYGVAEINEKKEIISIEEKPTLPKSRFAITGIYFFDKNVVKNAKECTVSERGELEIIDLLKIYLKRKELDLSFLGRGTTWLDTGTWESLIEASNFVRSIENRQGYKIGCPEEVAWRQGFITKNDIIKCTSEYKKNDYKEYLLKIIEENKTK